jgi:hypothetical protein
MRTGWVFLRASDATTGKQPGPEGATSTDRLEGGPMRPRFVVLASLLAALAALAVPSLGSAVPSHTRGLTINATPNPIFAGDALLIYGQLNRQPAAGQTVVLYHREPGWGRGYVRGSQTKTDAHGVYSFPRAEGLVTTNRDWFVRAGGVQSRAVFEAVQALVSLSPSSTAQDTNHPVVFTGKVTPSHVGQRVLLQEQTASGDGWRTLRSVRIGRGSNFAMSCRWRVPGSRDVRALFQGDRRNTSGASDPVSVTIQQAQVPGFTINTSAPILDHGKQATISGVLNRPNTEVTLFARSPGHGGFEPVQHTTTDSNGNYKFPPQAPTQNTLYEVRTTFSPFAQSAVLFEGARDVIAMGASTTNTVVGGKVAFTGTVLPDKAGHLVYLERLAADGDWHVADVQRVTNRSTFQFGWQFGAPRNRSFRARILGDGQNLGDASDPVTIAVGAAPTASLPPAS